MTINIFSQFSSAIGVMKTHNYSRVKYLKNKKLSEIVGKNNKSYVKNIIDWKKYTNQLELINKKSLGN